MIYNKYEINEARAQAVKLVFDMASKGKTYGDIINTLNELGYKTVRNKPFSKNSITEMLRNKKYTGVYIFVITSYSIHYTKLYDSLYL